MTPSIVLYCFILMSIIFSSSSFCSGSYEDISDKFANSSKSFNEVQKKEENEFTNDISSLKNITDTDSLRETAIKYRTELKTSRMDYLDLSTENLDLQKNIKLTEKILCHLKIKTYVIQEIESYEADLDSYEITVREIENYEAGMDSHHSYESIDANSTSIFQPDKDFLNNLTDPYVRREEYRRQKWDFYLDMCPTEKIKKLKEKINSYPDIFEKMNFSTALAKLHRKISAELRESATALKNYPTDYTLYSGGEEFNVIPVLFKGLSLDSRMKTEINKNLNFRPNLKL